MTKNTPYSYHNFLFPFLWNDDAGVHSRRKFSKCLNENWVMQKDFDNGSNQQFSDEKYNQYHYFNPSARQIIYSDGKKSDVVWNYLYNISAEDNARYVIKNQKDCYELGISKIRLKLFDTGIGILIFELVNYSHPEPDDINKINDWGRQIYSPCMSNGISLICPDEISLHIGDKTITSDFVNNINSFDTTNLTDVIKSFFTNITHTVTANRKDVSRKVFYIEPVIDNRMFVTCYYANKRFSDAVSEQSNGEYAYITSAHQKPLNISIFSNPAADLYKYIYVDGNGLTCQSRTLLRDMLGKEHVYDRWLEYGSITGICEYSFVTLTSKIHQDDYLVRNFLTQYLEMIIIILAQRATLLNFERMISNCAKGKKSISEIHKRYLFFKSQLLLNEITPQQQGIELYNMMLDNMFIPEYSAQIENQIEDLYAQKTAKNETSENLILFILATLSIFEVINICTDWILNKNSGRIGYSAILFVVLIFVYLLSKIRKKF